MRHFAIFICFVLGLLSFAFSFLILAPTPFKQKFVELVIQPQIDHDLDHLVKSGTISNDNEPAVRKVVSRSYKNPAVYFLICVGGMSFLLGTTLLVLAYAIRLSLRIGK